MYTQVWVEDVRPVKFWLNQFFRQRKLDSYELPDLISQPITVAGEEGEISPFPI
jgi:hypothetical protein